MAELRYVFDAVATIKRALAGSVPLIGFAGSPFTLACYMIEGRGQCRFRQPCAAWPTPARTCSRNSSRSTRARSPRISNAQIARRRRRRDDLRHLGRAAVGGRVSRVLAGDRCAACWRGSRPGADGQAVPTIVFTKGGGGWLPSIAACGAAAVGVDWTVDLARARARCGERVALQGNLDPLILLTDPATIAREAAAIVRAAGPRPVTSSISVTASCPARRRDNVAALVDAVHATSTKTRAGA